MDKWAWACVAVAVAGDVDVGWDAQIIITNAPDVKSENAHDAMQWRKPRRYEEMKRCENSECGE